MRAAVDADETTTVWREAGAMELSAELVVFKRDDGTWSWRLTAMAGETIAADVSAGYANEVDCQRIADAVVNGTFRDAVRVLQA
jgi:uncharacterized protein YegP (UPF0339 family)